LKLTSFGGAGTVTGSKHLLSHNGKHILVDCGLFQGLKNLRELNWEPLPIAPKELDAVVLTHAHLDHSGYLPRLVRDGFRGRIYATAATRDVAELILKDSGHLQEKDAEYANRKGFSKHKPALPLYTVQDAERALKQFSNVPFGKPAPLPDGATLTFRYAGHILGAATAEIDWGGKRIVFSGDLGRYDDPMLFDPQPVTEADYVVIESTYGNRTHAPSDAAEALGAVIETTVGRGGTVVIPAFAVGRAQLLLYYPSIWTVRWRSTPASCSAITSPTTACPPRSVMPPAGSPRIPARSRNPSRSPPADSPRSSSRPAAWRPAAACCTTSRRSRPSARTRSCSPATRPQERAARRCCKAHAKSGFTVNGCRSMRRSPTCRNCPRTPMPTS
jgi:glyoxylase-like metal-dependent hydrolase (beta-lactamase superfamily II)